MNVPALLNALVIMLVFSDTAGGASADCHPAHRTVLVETFHQGHTLATVARQLGIPDGTARSRLHYAAISEGPESDERGRAPMPVRLRRDLDGYGPQSAEAVLIPKRTRMFAHLG
jgi:hypothetical protein